MKSQIELQRSRFGWALISIVMIERECMKIIVCSLADYKSGDYINTICSTFREHLCGGLLKESLLFHVYRDDETLVAYAYAKGWQGDPDDEIFEEYEPDHQESCQVHGTDYSDECLCCVYLIREEHADRLTFCLYQEFLDGLSSEELFNMTFSRSKTLKEINDRYRHLVE